MTGSISKDTTREWSSPAVEHERLCITQRSKYRATYTLHHIFRRFMKNLGKIIVFSSRHYNTPTQIRQFLKKKRLPFILTRYSL